MKAKLKFSDELVQVMTLKSFIMIFWYRLKQLALQSPLTKLDCSTLLVVLVFTIFNGESIFTVLYLLLFYFID